MSPSFFAIAPLLLLLLFAPSPSSAAGSATPLQRAVGRPHPTLAPRSSVHAQPIAVPLYRRDPTFLYSAFDNASAVAASAGKPFLNPDGTVDLKALDGHIATLGQKYAAATHALQRNTGQNAPSWFHELAQIGGGGTGGSPTTRSEQKGQLRKRSARGQGAVSLTNHSNSYWTGAMTIGGQTVLVDFDTGAADLFVAPSAGYTPGNSSHDLGRSFDNLYASGSRATGQLFSDTISIAGLSADNQTVGISNTTVDGLKSIAGMAYQSLSSTNSKPFVNTLCDAGALAECKFGFVLTENAPMLYLGGTETSKYQGSLVSAPVTDQSYWVASSKVYSGHTYVMDMEALIDTGTTLVIGPNDQVKRLLEQAGLQTYVSDGGSVQATYNCSNPPAIGFDFGNVVFPILPQHFAYGGDGVNCTAGVVGSGDNAGSRWILGDTFLRGVYAEFSFDHNTISFALANP